MRWFTSDEHHGHEHVIQYCSRPFLSVEDMTNGLIERHNALVAPEDTVWHLGDFSFKHQLVAQILARMNGRHHLICGNHDRCHPCHAKHVGAKQRYLDYGFLSVDERLSLRLDGGIEVLLCHMPYEVDARHARNGPGSYARYRPCDVGFPLLHGHSHSARGHRVNGRQIDVGVDANGWAPISERQIVQIISAGRDLSASDVF